MDVCNPMKPKGILVYALCEKEIILSERSYYDNCLKNAGKERGQNVINCKVFHSQSRCCFFTCIISIQKWHICIIMYK